MSVEPIEELNRKQKAGQLGWSPGHFYSPIPDLEEVWRHQSEIFSHPPVVPGVDLRLDRQLALLDRLAPHYQGLPFTETKHPGLRYYYDNPNFSYGESIVLYCMLKLLRPRRIVEIGSGHSSCVILDTNEQALENAMQCTFIEPYPDLLLGLMQPGDRERVRLYRERVQDVDPALFDELEAGDILFIDSSHVSKVGSDVNHIIFQLLPRLRPGVYIHVHDIMVGFEYPREWVYQGRSWNEAYLIRAFLQYNAAFTIELFNSYLGWYHREAFIARLPLVDRNPGTSLWLRRSEDR
jgi:hypothetical protein